MLATDPVFRLPPDVDLRLAITPLAEVLDPFQEFLGVKAMQDKTAGLIGERKLRYAVLDTGVDANHRDLAGQISDTADFTGSMWGADDRNGHGCVAPTDQVYTSLCGLQAIEKVFKEAAGVAHFLPDKSIVLDVSRRNMHTISRNEQGEFVRSKILCVQKLPYSGKVFQVVTSQGMLTLTPWHPVYVQTSARGTEKTVVRRRADGLKNGDRIVIPAAGPGVSGEHIKLTIDNEWPCMFCDHVAAAGERRQCRKCGKGKWHGGPTPVEFNLDEQLAYFAGLVASDGHVSKKPNQYAVLFSNCDHRLLLEFGSLAKSIFGVGATNRNGRDLECNCKRMWMTLRAIGIPAGAKSRTIEFPDLIAKSPRSVICAFLAGIIEGDGNVRRKVRIATGSRKFADKTAMLCRTIGIRASVSVVKPSKAGLAKTANESFCITIAGDVEILSYLRVKDGSVVAPAKPQRTAAVKSIVQIDYSGPMYDFTIEKHHNYVANGHLVSNTWCAGAIAARADDFGVRGIAYKAELLCGKVLGDNGSGNERGIAEGLKWAYQKGADIFSLSLGGGQMSESLHKLFAEVSQQPGKFIFCAAGNDGGPVNFPAKWAEVIAVGAIDAKGVLTQFTSRGPELDILAPGVEILSTVPGNRHGTMTGTSMATPIAAAIGGLVYAAATNAGRGKEFDTTQEMILALRKTGHCEGGDVCKYPVIDPRALAKATDAAVQPTPTTPTSPPAPVAGVPTRVLVFAGGRQFEFLGGREIKG